MQYMPHSLVGGRVATTGQLQVFGGSSSTDFALAVFPAANNGPVFFEIFGDGHGFLGPNVTNTLSWSTAGAFSIAAPTSGATLNLTFLNNVGGLVMGDGTASAEAFFSPTHAFELGTISNVGMSFFVNNGSPAQTISAAGNFTLFAPSSGGTLTVNGLTANNTILQSSTGAASTFGMGWNIALSSTSWNIYTNSTDNLAIGTVGAAFVQLVTNSATRILINSSGNVTIAAPSSGTAVAITGVAGATGLSVTTGHTGIVDFDGADCYIGPNAASSGSGGQLRIRKDTGASAWYLGLPQSAAAVNFFIYDAVNAREVLNIAPGGNVNIDAPSSGTTLNMSAVAAGTILNLSDGTVSAVGTFSGTEFNWGTASAHTFALVTNGNVRASISSGGTFTINAPASGNALSVSGLANQYAEAIIGSSTASQSFGLIIESGTNSSDIALRISNQAVTQNFLECVGDGSGFIGYNGTNQVINWTSAGVTTVKVSGTTIYSVNGTSGPTLQGYGPTAAALVDMTPDTGTFTMTYTGFTANPTGTAKWSRNGNQVTLLFPAATSASNAVTMTATGLPAEIQPATTQNFIIGQGLIQNANGTVFADVGLTLTASSGTVTFSWNAGTNSWGGGGFTGGSQTKGVNQPFMITYLLN